MKNNIELILGIIAIIITLWGTMICTKLEDIEIAIIKSNMTYKEYCEYYPEECEELF